MTSAGAIVPKHAVVDGFLPPELADGILAYAIEHHEAFVPTQMNKPGLAEPVVDPRRMYLFDGFGALEQAFREVVSEQFAALCASCGLAPFEIAGWDINIACQREGAFINEHLDIGMTGAGETAFSKRMLSLVLYLHREPKGFSGGDFVLKPFAGAGEPARIGPQHNRLLAFPSMAKHVVETISVPGDGWEDARFSVNCWLMRA